MGCFDNSCLLSRHPIHWQDKCLILPLLKGKYTNHNKGPFMHLQVAFPPIYGTYNDYGSIENIKETPITKFLESYFETSIENIVECITTRKETYGSYSALQKAYSKNFKLQELDAISKDSLTKLHFTVDENGVIGHPLWTSHIEFLTNKLKRPNPEANTQFILVSEEGRGQIALKGVYADSCKDIHSLSTFLKDANDYEARLSANLMWAEDIFLHGIPSALHAKARLLLNLTCTFVKADIYNKTLEIARNQIAESIKTSYDAGKFERDEQHREEVAFKLIREEIPYTEELLKSINLEYLYNRLSRQGMIDRELKDAVFQRIPAFSENHVMQAPHLALIKNLPSEALLQCMEELKTFTKACWTTNIVVIETRSMEQHGDLSAMLEYFDAFGELGHKKETADSEGSDYEEE